MVAATAVVVAVAAAVDVVVVVAVAAAVDVVVVVATHAHTWSRSLPILTLNL